MIYLSSEMSFNILTKIKKYCSSAFSIDYVNEALSIFAKIRLTDIDVNRGDDNIAALKLLLQCSFIQESLQLLQVWHLNLHNCADVLSLWVNWNQLKFIAINSIVNEYSVNVEKCKEKINKIKEDIWRNSSDTSIQITYCSE